MPDILIRGMKMPKGCRECFACFTGRDDNDEPTTYCTLTEPASPTDCWGVIDGIDHQRQRMDFCPLHELPEHGDLIDRDALGEAPTYYGSHCNLDEVEDWINSAPVVIPSNKEETE